MMMWSRSNDEQSSKMDTGALALGSPTPPPIKLPTDVLKRIVAFLPDFKDLATWRGLDRGLRQAVDDQAARRVRLRYSCLKSLVNENATKWRGFKADGYNWLEILHANYPRVIDIVEFDPARGEGEPWFRRRFAFTDDRTLLIDGFHEKRSELLIFYFRFEHSKRLNYDKRRPISTYFAGLNEGDLLSPLTESGTVMLIHYRNYQEDKKRILVRTRASFGNKAKFQYFIPPFIVQVPAVPDRHQVHVEVERIMKRFLISGENEGGGEVGGMARRGGGGWVFFPSACTRSTRLLILD